MFRVTKKSNHFSRTRRCKAVVCVALTLLVLSVLLSGCADRGSAVVIQGEQTEGNEESLLEAEPYGEQPMTSGDREPMSPDDKVETSVEITGESVASMRIYVHVCGQVRTPGVYVLPEGSRVWDAVEAAGGLTEEARPEAVNLALVITDGSKVTIPDGSQAQDQGFSWYETGAGVQGTMDGNAQGISSVENESGLVDLNRATVEDLMTIPGIGQSRAQAIVAYRQSHGSFGSIQEIMQVTGIKEGLFEAIRQYITVGG